MTTAAPEGALAVDSTQGDYEAQEPPGWARRAVEGTPVMSTEPRSGARKGGSLITALARASNAEDVVQVIMERGGAATGGELPGAAAQLVRSIARNASAAVEESAPATLRQDRRTERGGTVSPRAMKSVRRQVLRSRSRKTQHSSSAAKGSPTSQGLGANNVMKLADKLLKLIHLAESNRRSEAQAQVRMAEDTAQARAEGGVGGSDPESTESESMNIQTLQQEVLESVLSAIELLQERREGDPDGRHEWW